MAVASVHVIISGRVQGVGYRYWLRGEAERLGVDGWCRNRTEGTVEAVLAGDAEAVDGLITLCWKGPPGAAVSGVDARPSDESPSRGFRILPDSD